MPKNNPKAYHQDSTPVESFKFDKDADAAAQAQFQPVFDIDTGARKMTQTVQKSRIKAQMESHKKPKNRVK